MFPTGKDLSLISLIATSPQDLSSPNVCNSTDIRVHISPGATPTLIGHFVVQRYFQRTKNTEIIFFMVTP